MPALARRDGDAAAECSSVAPMDSQRWSGCRLPAWRIEAGIEAPVIVLDLTREKIRFLASENIDDAVDDDFGGPTRRVGKLGPGCPRVGGRVVDVHAGDAVRIAAADDPKLAASLDHRQVIAHSGHLCAQAPVFARGVDQDPARAPAPSDDVQPPSVRYHAVAPAWLDHRWKGLPLVRTGAEPPKIVLGWPILMTEMTSGDVCTAADIELVTELRRREMVARIWQRRSH